MRKAKTIPEKKSCILHPFNAKNRVLIRKAPKLQIWNGVFYNNLQNKLYLNDKKSTKIAKFL